MHENELLQYRVYFGRMLRPIDRFYTEQTEPVKSCFQYLRQRIIAHDARITEGWKYGMPFFLFEGRMFCYLWSHKEHHLPYIGFVDGKLLDHPQLLQEKRARMKILLLQPDQDLPLRVIDDLLRRAVRLRLR